MLKLQITAALQPKRKASRFTSSQRASPQLGSAQTLLDDYLIAKSSEDMTKSWPNLCKLLPLKPLKPNPNEDGALISSIIRWCSGYFKFSKDFFSPFDWVIILLHEAFFSIVGIIRERSISALPCPLFFAVCFLFETLVQADSFHTILYLIRFYPPHSSPLQANSPLNSSGNRVPKHLLEVSEDAGIGPSSIVRVVSQTAAVHLVPTVSSLCVMAFWASVPNLLDVSPAAERHSVHTSSSSRHWLHRSEILSARGGRISKCGNSGTWNEWTRFAALLLLPIDLHKSRKYLENISSMTRYRKRGRKIWSSRFLVRPSGIHQISCPKIGIRQSFWGKESNGPPRNMQPAGCFFKFKSEFSQ